MSLKGVLLNSAGSIVASDVFYTLTLVRIYWLMFLALFVMLPSYHCLTKNLTIHKWPFCTISCFLLYPVVWLGVYHFTFLILYAIRKAFFSSTAFRAPQCSGLLFLKSFFNLNDNTRIHWSWFKWVGKALIHSITNVFNNILYGGLRVRRRSI